MLNIYAQSVDEYRDAVRSTQAHLITVFNKNFHDYVTKLNVHYSSDSFFFGSVLQGMRN